MPSSSIQRSSAASLTAGDLSRGARTFLAQATRHGSGGNTLSESGAPTGAYFGNGLESLALGDIHSGHAQDELRHVNF